ncbi:hypothetical protein WJ973_08520 [Achromobacter xylosoxidans]|uniref:hypothetical protein n=1 Tax=Alcaligenes xylosoxydans xylosoxydans TaxID=85698 RepID=UPI001E330E13|nr:hypothetical protein [Achromobacter xylosoxidans]
MKNTAMIPKSIVAIRVFLNIGILRKKAAARSAATGLACRARGSCARVSEELFRLNRIYQSVTKSILQR